MTIRTRTTVSRSIHGAAGPLFLLLAALVAATAAQAAAPPGTVNYQGVLRDPNGAPRDGSFDMVFRFLDDPNAGSEILVDSHLAAGTGAVAVSGGLFNVGLGSGALSDGAAVLPNDPYTSLGEVFRDFQDVWMEIQIDGETLTPRVKVVSAAYALNAGLLDGKDSSELLDTSASAQVKAGNLEVNDLTLAGADLLFPGAVPGNTGPFLRGASTFAFLLAGDADTDDLFLRAGNSLDDGRIAIFGDSTFELRSGSGLFRFVNGDTNVETARLDGAGNLQLDGDLTISGADLLFPGALPGSTGPFLRGTSSFTQILAGDADTDDLFLYAGDSFDDGRIAIFGDGTFELRAGSGLFSFVNGVTGVQIARLDGAGNLQVDSDLTISGTDLLFPGAAAGSTGPFLRGTGSEAWLLAGDADTDDLFLYAGNSPDDGSISMFGDSTLELRSGNGFFSFVNGGTGAESASLDGAGNFQIDGNLQIDGFLDDDFDIDILDTTTITVSSNPADLTFAGANMELNLGDTSGDDVNIPGDLFVTGTKSFVQNHPLRDDLSIAYVALEGAEAGTYTRGTATLQGGVARVALDETFSWTTNPEIGLTAHLTPRGGWADLYVESLTTEELVVRSDDGSDTGFDYVVHGLRIGHEEFPVVQPRRRDAPVPSETAARARYQGIEELRRHSALERYRAMPAQAGAESSARAGGRTVAGIPAGGAAGPAEALRRAVGVDDSRLDPEPAAPPTAAGAGSTVAEGRSDQAPAPLPGQMDPAREEPAGKSGATVPGGGLSAGPPMDAQGNVYARSFRPSAGDLASLVPVSEPVEAGDVLAIAPDAPGIMRLARLDGDTAVLGVVAASPGVVLGARPPDGEIGARAGAGDAPAGSGAPGEEAGSGGAREVPVAVSGVVLCKVDAGYGSILPGDLLTTSATPGHARRADDPRPGTILGKALEPLEDGMGRIRVLVTLR